MLSMCAALGSITGTAKGKENTIPIRKGEMEDHYKEIRLSS